MLAGDESPATEAEDAARSFLARFAQADNPEVFVFVTLIFVMKHKLTNAWFAQADIQRPFGVFPKIHTNLGVRSSLTLALSVSIESTQGLYKGGSLRDTWTQRLDPRYLGPLKMVRNQWELSQNG